MLTEAKKQIRVTFITIKYAIMREMLNKGTFLMNISFMILNNATFIIQWLVLYGIKDNVGGYTFSQILLLWGMAASTFGFTHFFFEKAYSLSDLITNGKLDSYLVQPKNVLISAITSEVQSSALGDMIYGIIMLIVSGFTITKGILFILFSICGGIIMTDIAIIYGSLSFWFKKSDMIADTANSFVTHFATYPDGIFEGAIRIIFYTIIPVAFINYIPIWIMTTFNLKLTLIVIAITIIWTILAFKVFYKGLKNYSSSNLMIAKI